MMLTTYFTIPTLAAGGTTVLPGAYRRSDIAEELWLASGVIRHLHLHGDVVGGNHLDLAIYDAITAQGNPVAAGPSSKLFTLPGAGYTITPNRTVVTAGVTHGMDLVLTGGTQPPAALTALGLMWRKTLVVSGGMADMELDLLCTSGIVITIAAPAATTASSRLALSWEPDILGSMRREQSVLARTGVLQIA